MGILGPLGLVVHSGLDGVAIGLGFAASAEVGIVVGLAVMAHDFADGINITTLTLEGGGSRRTVLTILALDAVAAPIGALIGISLGVTPAVLGILLAAFAGVFVAVGAGHLLPEAQHEPLQAPPLVLLAALGAALVIAIRLLGETGHPDAAGHSARTRTRTRRPISQAATTVVNGTAARMPSEPTSVRTISTATISPLAT